MHIIYITWLINTQDRYRFYSSHFAIENQLHVQYSCFTFLSVYAFQKLISSTICSWVRFKTEEFFFLSAKVLWGHSLSWFPTCTSIEHGEIKLTLRAQPSPLCEMIQHLKNSILLGGN